MKTLVEIGFGDPDSPVYVTFPSDGSPVPQIGDVVSHIDDRTPGTGRLVVTERHLHFQTRQGFTTAIVSVWCEPEPAELEPPPQDDAAEAEAEAEA